MNQAQPHILNILLVEDNPGDMVLIRETLREMTSANFEFTHVSTLAEADTTLENKNFDIILLDLNLPDGKGLGNIEHISQLAPETPIIMLTGLKDEMTAVEAVRQGAQDYLVKGDMAPDLFWRAMRYAVERKNIEEKLQKAKLQAEAATKAKSEFLAHISHEIRTPLNIILGAADLLSETSLDERQKQFVDIFKTSGDTLLFLINDLLDFSKAEAGKVDIENISFNLNDLIEEIHKFLQIAAEKRQNQLEFEISPEIPEWIVSDPQRLRQVLFNLLGNAVKFTENGKIYLKAGIKNTPQGTPKMLEFTVQDTGIGIPKDKVKSIFEAFTQSDSSTSRKFGGTGLGLAICLKLVKLMGGEIQVKSEPGKGSSFTFSIQFTEGTPVSKDDPAAKMPGAPGKGSGAGLPRLNLSRPLHILLVDDSQDNRLLIKAILEKEDITLEEACNGAEALDKFKEHAFDMVLMDMQMPEVDGYTSTGNIRAWEQENQKPSVPVIALTAYSRKEDRDKCLDAGCSEYLRKPIRKEELFSVIWKFSDTAGLEKTLETAGAESQVTVEVDPVIQDLIPDYLKNKQHEIEEIRKSLEREDFDKAVTIGHGMAGSGASYGFADITRIGRAIEDSAKLKDKAAVENHACELADYLIKVKVVYS